MDSKDLNKLIRISETVRALSAQAQKEDRRNLQPYVGLYKAQYNLIHPIFYDEMDFQLEFQALGKPGEISYYGVKPALVGLSTFIDSVIREKTLNNRQHGEEFAKEYFFDEDKPFSTYKQVTSIINQAVATLRIVDNFIEASSLDFFLAVNTQTEIKIITKKLFPNKPTFITAKKKFISQWSGNNLEVKTSKYFHDRFLIIDDTQVWHLGPSLNHLGKKPMMISMIGDPDIQKTITDIFDKEWLKAVSV